MSDFRAIRITNDTIIRTILFILATFVLFQLRELLILVLVSIVIASFVEAGVRVFTQYRISRAVSVPLIFSVTLLIFIGVFYAFVPLVVKELSGMITLILNYLPAGSTTTTASIQSASHFVDTLSKNGSSVTDLLASFKKASSSLSQGATSVIGSTFGGLMNIILVVVMAFYLSIQERGIDNFLRIFTSKKNEHYVLDLWARTQRKIGLWFKGQLFLGLVVGAITFIVLLLMGVQYAFLVGLISGIAELIPFGVIFAAIPAILFAVIDGGILLGVKVFIFYIVIHQIENYILNPVIARRMVGIPPLVVLLAFLIGIQVAGFLGAVVAMPVAVFVLEYLSDLEKKKLSPIVPSVPL